MKTTVTNHKVYDLPNGWKFSVVENVNMQGHHELGFWNPDNPLLKEVKTGMVVDMFDVADYMQKAYTNPLKLYTELV